MHVPGILFRKRLFDDFFCIDVERQPYIVAIIVVIIINTDLKDCKTTLKNGLPASHGN